MQNITLTSSTRTPYNTNITRQRLSKSIQIGVIYSKRLGTSHKVYIVKIDNVYQTVAISVCGNHTNIQGVGLNANGDIMEINKKHIRYWG